MKNILSKTNEKLQLDSSKKEVGFVRSVRGFLAYIDGLPEVKINDIVENETGARGVVSALLPDRAEVLLLDDSPVLPGQLFYRTGKRLNLRVGPFLLGRVINPLGLPVDGKSPFVMTATQQFEELDKPAPSINEREFIKEQLHTGITVVDTLLPLAKGQRELIVGDARSGKTDFIIDIIVNQKNSNIICIYACIGKTITEVRTFIDLLQAHNAMEYTTVVSTSSTDPAPLIYLAPYSAFTVAEYFQKQGRDVLLILDDMGNHAKIYREISLLSDKSPGRESYPGDIFYQHSHLLERAGDFKKEVGNGSITALPIIELNLNDFTTFIPTNLMSMTDGHFLFKAALYNQGQRPAIDTPLSVTRVGHQTQHHIQHLIATRIKQVIAQASQLETVSRFSFELPEQTRLLLRQRNAIEELIKQAPLTCIPVEIQIALLSLPFVPAFKDKEKDFYTVNQPKLVENFLTNPKLKELRGKILEFKDDKELFEALQNVAGIILTQTDQTAGQIPKKEGQQPAVPVENVAGDTTQEVAANG